MAEKRKGRKRKEELYPSGDEKPEKPDPEEYKVAEWMKKNLPTKKTKFLSHNVEYFTGSKGVDALMESKWGKPLKEGEDPLFLTRMDAVEFLDKMLRHKFFHRAKKIPVSEQELKAKMKKKVKKDDKKEDEKSEEKKKKEEEAAESSHAEGKEGTQQDDREKKKKKIRLEMHLEQFFHDGLDAYVWIYDPIPFYYWLFGALVVLGAIAICMFPLWPPSVRMGVYYLSVAAAGFLMFIIALAIIRLIVFCLLWMLTVGQHHLWLFPNLTEDVGFFASFWPLYQYEYKGGEKKPSKKKKKDKDSDNEEEDKTEKEDEEDDDAEEGEDMEEDRSQGEDENSAESKLDDERGAGTDRDRDSETESEGSSQQSQTGKDFEMVDKDEVKDS
ncbi:translocation protein SEC62 [Homalodisca vitripennis]|nr:translocation protein SEC62 [Homalodisca vitripennis]